MARYTTPERVIRRVGLSNLNTSETTTVNDEDITFINGVSSYALETTPVAAITSITGTVASADYTFVLDTDYRLNGNNVEWIATGTMPDNGTIFYVTYTYTNILNSIYDYIEDASAFIEEVVGKTWGGGGATPEEVPALVQAVATDLACVYLLLRQSGGGTTSTAGLSYTIGKLSVDNKSSSSEMDSDKEVGIYLKRAEKGLELLKMPPGEEGAAGSAPHTLRMGKVYPNQAPDPYTGAQYSYDGTSYTTSNWGVR
jgi:hypothetical protein